MRSLDVFVTLKMSIQFPYKRVLFHLIFSDVSNTNIECWHLRLQCTDAGKRAIITSHTFIFVISVAVCRQPAARHIYGKNWPTNSYLINNLNLRVSTLCMLCDGYLFCNKRRMHATINCPFTNSNFQISVTFHISRCKK